jgi:hypothetical protein
MAHVSGSLCLYVAVEAALPTLQPTVSGGHPAVRRSVSQQEAVGFPARRCRVGPVFAAVFGNSLPADAFRNLWLGEACRTTRS